MNDYERLLRAMADAGVAFVIVGGVAATIHGSSRLTSDLDVVYQRTPHNLGRLVTALAPLNPYLRGAPPGLPFQFDAETLRRGLNFTLTSDAGAIDLLGELSGVGSYESVYASSESISLFGLSVRCIDLDALIESKRAAGRPKDLEAIAELELIRQERNR